MQSHWWVRGTAEYGVYFRKLWEEHKNNEITDCETVVTALSSRSGKINRKLRIDIAVVKIIEKKILGYIICKHKYKAYTFMKEGVRNDDFVLHHRDTKMRKWRDGKLITTEVY